MGWCIMCIPKGRESKRRNYCINSDQILLNNNDQRHMGLRTGVEVYYVRLPSLF